MSSQYSADGAIRHWLPDEFELMSALETGMLMLVPGGLVVLGMPLLVKELAANERRFQTGAFPWATLACGSCLVLVQGASIFIRYHDEQFSWDSTETASALSLSASIGTSAIIVAAYMQSVHVPGSLNIFLAITALFDIAFARDLFLRSCSQPVATLQHCIVFLKIIFSAIAGNQDNIAHRSLEFRKGNVSQKRFGYSNIFLLGWLNTSFTIFRSGYRSLTILPSIRPAFSSQRLLRRFYDQWSRVDKSSSTALVTALLRSIKWQCGLAALTHVGVMAFTVAQPYLILDTMEVILHREGEQSDTSRNLIISWATVVIGLSAMRNLCEYGIDSLLTSLRGMLLPAIYDKMHRLPAEDILVIDTTRLISTDVRDVEKAFLLVYELLWTTCQVTGGIWVSYRFIGPAAFLLLLPACITYFTKVFTSKYLADARAEWHEAATNRETRISNMVAQLKNIRAMELCKSVAQRMEREFAVESKASGRERQQVLWTFSQTAINWTISPAVAFSAGYFWTRAEHLMSTAEIVAVTCALYNACYPLVMMHMYVGRRKMGFPAIERIQTFLALDELRDVCRKPEAPIGLPDSSEAVNGHQHPAIQVVNVTVKSSADEIILRHINMNIPRGTLALMWGPMKCGKTTFAKMLLGEVEPNTGAISIDSDHISYCSQECWVPDLTFQEAVIGTLGLNATRYEAVIRACALDVDLNTLPDCSQTRIGKAGCNLNDSQRQRLSLARSVYARNDTIVLDDMFSHVDPDTAAQVFNQLFGSSGMVRQWNCTVIMITNRLELLDSADHVYQFTKDGHIEKHESSSHESSSAANSDYAFSVNSTAATDTKLTESTDSAQLTDGSGATEVVGSLPLLPLVADEADHTPQEIDGKFSDLPPYLKALSSAGPFPIVAWLCIMSTTSISAFMPMYCLFAWLTESPGSHECLHVYLGLCALYIILNVSSGAFYFSFVLPKASKRLHGRLLQVIMGAKTQYGKSHARLILKSIGSKLSFNMRRQAIILNQLLLGAHDCTIELLLVTSASRYPIYMMLCIIVSYAITQWIYLRSCRQLTKLQSAASTEVIAHIEDTGHAIRYIRSFGWQTTYLRRFFATLDKLQSVNAQIDDLSRWLNVTIDIIMAAATVLLLRDILSRRESISTAWLGLSLISALVSQIGVSQQIKFTTSFVLELSCVREIDDFLLHTPQEQDIPTTSAVSDNWPSDGVIEFHDVSASYPDANGARFTALHDITLNIPSGYLVAVMGSSGSGKTTFLESILRMGDSTGTIRIDGVNLQTVPCELLRRKITTITQEGLALDATLRFNIYPYDGPQPSEADIMAVLQQVHLWAPVTSSGGLQAKFSDMKFTTAQRRLLYLARAILHQSTTDSKIVLIDEAASALRSESVDEFDAIVESAFTGCTVLLVTHAEPLNSVDMVLQFDSGKLDSVLRRRADGQFVEVDGDLTDMV